MGHGDGAPGPTSHEERVKQRIQVVYTRQMRERQIFMQELKDFRKKKEKKMFISITNAVGPRWYQALSVPQRMALDNLNVAVYQDDLEGRPNRTASIMRSLGLYPRPSRKDLMYCIDICNHDGMEMLAQLYLATFGFSIEGKRESYSLNAKLILSAILYLGMEHLLFLLRERFRPDITVGEAPPKPKPKPEPPVASPYLQKMVAFLYERPVQKRPPPPPLPNLDDLNDPYEEEPIITKPPPPPPPPPPPKKTIPKDVCDQLAGILRIHPARADVPEYQGKLMKSGRGKSRQLKQNVENKKVYGMQLNRKKKTYRRKPVAPSTGMTNTRYTINGVCEYNGKAWYILGNVSILPAQGDLIHGGYASVQNENVNIHCGYRGRQPPPKPQPCNCVKQWQDAVFEYIKNTKCYCGHRYDFYNEGTFPPEELPFFVKPTPHSALQFNYHTIFNTDPKELQVDKDFKRIWETDSLLQVDTGIKVVKEDKKKKKKDRSNTCLGSRPRPEDYLRCAIRFMRRLNIAARLPDLHLVPELREWMRRRIYGPLNRQERADMLRKSTTYWAFFTTLGSKSYGHVPVPKEPQFGGHTTWLEKQKLNNNFKTFTNRYKLALYRSHAKLINLFWRTMFQAEMRDKQFRQIYFSYLFSCMEEIQLIPYLAREVQERANSMRVGRYVCLPRGAEDLE